VHARDGGWRRGWGRNCAVNETETFVGRGREEGDKRNVESKKQKGRRNKSAARKLGGDDRKETLYRGLNIEKELEKKRTG